MIILFHVYCEPLVYKKKIITRVRLKIFYVTFVFLYERVFTVDLTASVRRATGPHRDDSVQGSLISVSLARS